MSKLITIRDRLYNKMRSEKGKRSFSDVIESYMNKCEPAQQSAKIEAQAVAVPQTEKGMDNV